MNKDIVWKTINVNMRVEGNLFIHPKTTTTPNHHLQMKKKKKMQCARMHFAKKKSLLVDLPCSFNLLLCHADNVGPLFNLKFKQI